MDQWPLTTSLPEKRRRRALSICTLALLMFTGCRNHQRDEDAALRATESQATWAQSMQVAGLPNLHKVDPRVYRGAQPTAEGFRHLQSMGVKTVIALRSADTDTPLLTDLGLDLHWIPMNAAWTDDQAIASALDLLADDSRAPFFIHCRHGADRTGLMVALYRVVHCGWTRQDALAEMRQGGFGFFPLYRNLVSYVSQADVARFTANRDHAPLAALRE